MLKVSDKVLVSASQDHLKGVSDHVKGHLLLLLDVLMMIEDPDLRFVLKKAKWIERYNLGKNTINTFVSILSNDKIIGDTFFLFLTKREGVVFRELDIDSITTFIDFLNNNLELILVGDEKQLDKFKIPLGRKFRIADFKNSEFDFRLIIYKIFNYDKFTDKKGLKTKTGFYEAYHLTQNLGTKTCLYCNRLYANTIYNQEKKEGMIRPELDHFFDKASYPYFALSFYNLIPSCKTCNSTLKHTYKFNLEDNLHPYSSGMNDYARFTYLPNTTESAYGVTDDLEVRIVPKDKVILDRRVQGNKDVFKLDEIYSEHADLVQDLLLKAIGTNWKYLSELKNMFEWDVTEEELHRVAFGVFPNIEDYHKRPFSQMINDIAEELNIK